jgi:hypothetical protein
MSTLNTTCQLSCTLQLVWPCELADKPKSTEKCLKVRKFFAQMLMDYGIHDKVRIPSCATLVRITKLTV